MHIDLTTVLDHLVSGTLKQAGGFGLTLILGGAGWLYHSAPGRAARAQLARILDPRRTPQVHPAPDGRRNPSTSCRRGKGRRKPPRR